MASRSGVTVKWFVSNLVKFFPIILSVPTIALVIYLNFNLIKPALNELSDFGSFIAAGRLAAAGENPYSTNSSLVHIIGTQGAERTLPSPNLNPPISVMIFQPLADLDPIQAVRAWRTSDCHSVWSCDSAISDYLPKTNISIAIDMDNKPSWNLEYNCAWSALCAFTCSCNRYMDFFGKRSIQIRWNSPWIGNCS